MTILGPPSERWDRLAEEAGNIFATRAWAECWWSHYGGGATPMILTDNEDAPTYVLPLYLSGGFLKKLRKEARRHERKLGRSFAVELRLSTAESVSSDMATLFRLHLQRWGQDAPFATGIERRFHEDFALVALENGWLRLWMLELDGSPVAARYGFRFGGVEYGYQSGRAPAYEEHSVGAVLLTHSIRSALQDGMKEYRLLRGDEAYKSRFADHENYVHTVAVPRTFLGRAAVKAALLRRA